MSTQSDLPDSVQKSKYWLQRRIEEIQMTRKDVLCDFQQKVDSIVSKPIEIAGYLMSIPNVSSDDLNAASIQLSSCSEFIWSLLIKVCEMIEKHQVHSPQMYVGLNELTPPQQGLYICSIPATAINLNYVQIESQNEMGTLCHSSGYPTVENSIVDSRKSNPNESSADVDKTLSEVQCDANVPGSGNEAGRNHDAMYKNDMPLSPVSRVAQCQLNGSCVNSLIMSDSDSSLLAHDTAHGISRKSLAGNNQCEILPTDLNHSSIMCTNTSKHHQQWEITESGTNTHLCHNKQAIGHGKTLLVGAHQYESDGSNSSRKIAISVQDSPQESGRDSRLCYNTQAMTHDKMLIGAHQCKPDGCDYSKKCAISDRDSSVENSVHDQPQPGSDAHQYQSEVCDSNRKKAISVQDSAIASSRHNHAQHVYLSDASHRDNALDRVNLESADSRQKIEPLSEITKPMIVNLKLDNDKQVYLSDGSKITKPVDDNHANGEHDQTVTDSYKFLESSDESASVTLSADPTIVNIQTNHFRYVYQSDPESNLSFDNANLSPDNTRITNVDSFEKNECKSPIMTEVNVNQQACQAISKHESEFEFIGIMSDIATPSNFSVQRKSDLQQLEILGYNLNKYFNYPDRIDQKLRIKSAPLEGECIAAEYTVDGNWYRGLVLQVTGIHTVIVRYVDYGNTDEILWQKAFKLPKMYQNIPPLSIKCSLAGIRPLQSEKGDGDGIRTWNEHVLKWFDEVMLNKTVNVIPVHKTSQLLYVQLFTNRETTGRNECISDVMVELGLAQYDIDEDEDFVPAVRGVSECDQISQPIQSSQVDYSAASLTDPKRPITKPADSKNDRCVNLLSNDATIVIDMPKNKKIHNKTPDDLGAWNPLVEDFQSGSNSYEIDNENACVMVEGYDPEKVPICKYYMKRQCWNGDRCPNLHQPPSESGKVKLKIPTFSGADISSMPLKEGDWCIARVTNVDKAHNFYVHVVKVLGNKNECIRITESLMNCVVSEELNRLSYDMSNYCNFGAKRMKNRLRPAIGELYIVLANEHISYHRGMVIESEAANTTHRHVSVHLIDLGKNAVVEDGFLYPMSPTFMHLPKQALHCTLWNSDPGKRALMEKIASSENCQNFVMEVNQVCGMTGGPIAVTLYNVASNRLEKLSLLHFKSQVIHSLPILPRSSRMANQ